MKRAIALSKRGFPAPNPHVGCVLVHGDTIVGEGYHHYAGGPHAERVALAHAGLLAAGADAYVTLEPCNHHGRTPPCVDGLLEAGVARVFVACADPNPKAMGGAERLRAHGVPVVMGVMAKQAAKANEQFFTSVELGRPMVVLKAGISLDGRIALENGESQWITSEAARRVAHRLRVACGAVLVGRGTVEADNPRLTARIPGVVNQPLRIVLDPRAALNSSYHVFDDQAPTMHVTGEIDLPGLLADLYEKGVRGILVEGGGRTVGEFVRQGLWDTIELFVAPKILGSGQTWVDGLKYEGLAQVPQGKLLKTSRIGPDLRITIKGC